MTSMRVSAVSLIANALVVGNNGLGVKGLNIPSTGTDGPAVLFQFVTLPEDNDVEFRMLITSLPSVGTLKTFENSSFIYDAPVPTTDSFIYEWFKDGVSQGSDIVNLTIISAGFELSPQTVNSVSVSLDPVFTFSSAFSLNPQTVNSSSMSLNPEFTFNDVFTLSPNTVNSSSISLDPLFAYSNAFSLNPQVVNSSSISLEPNFTFTGPFNLDPNVVNSTSIALKPIFSYGQVQTIGTVTASFAPDLYTVQFKS